MIDIKKVKADAARELREEAEESAKKKIVTKLRQIDQAERVLLNLRRELDALELDINGDI